MTRLSTTHEGIGDSLLVLDKTGQYNFYGGTVENMIRDPFTAPLIGEATFGDTLSFHLDYAQRGWGRLYPETGHGAWHGLFLLDGGGAMVCGYQDSHPRVAIIDRNGLLVMSETLPEEGYFSHILPYGADSILLCGKTPSGIILSVRDLSGQELWAHYPDLPADLALQCLVRNTSGGFLLLTNSCEESNLCSPTLATLDGTGQVISLKQLTGPLKTLGLCIAPRLSGGYFLLLARLNDDNTSTYSNEMVLLDENCNIEQILEVGTGVSGFYGSILTCANGDAVFTFHNHGDGVTTDAVRLSDSGQIIWQINLAVSGMQVLNVCEESPDGNFLLAGNSFDGVPINRWTWLVELSQSGEILRNKQSDFGSQNISIYMARTAWDGGIFTAGKFRHNSAGATESWLNRSQIDWSFEPMPESSSQ